MAELADARDLKSRSFTGVRVRSPPSAQLILKLTGCSSDGRVLRLGRRGPRFETGHPDKNIVKYEKCGSSSTARASVFQTEDEGSIPFFRSDLPYVPVAQVDRATAF